MRWLLAVEVVLALSLLGCTTPYAEQQRKMYWKWQRGELSDKEYQQRLKALKDEQPWGGIHGTAEQQREPIFWSADSDEILSWEGNFVEFMKR